MSAPVSDDGFVQCVCPKRGHHPDDLPKCMCAASEDPARDEANRLAYEEWSGRKARLTAIATKMGVELEVADV